MNSNHPSYFPGSTPPVIAEREETDQNDWFYCPRPKRWRWVVMVPKILSIVIPWCPCLCLVPGQTMEISKYQKLCDGGRGGIFCILLFFVCFQLADNGSSEVQIVSKDSNKCGAFYYFMYQNEIKSF